MMPMHRLALLWNAVPTSRTELEHRMMTRTLARRVSIAVSMTATVFALNTANAQAGAGPAATAPATPTAKASPLIGRWEGTIYAQGMQIPAVITIDSTSSGWSGSLLVAMLNPSPIAIASVVVKGDTVSMTMPEEGMGAFFQGLLSADKKTLNGMVAVQGDNSSTFQVTKAAPAAAKSPAQEEKRFQLQLKD